MAKSGTITNFYDATIYKGVTGVLNWNVDYDISTNTKSVTVSGSITNNSPYALSLNTGQYWGYSIKNFTDENTSTEQYVTGTSNRNDIEVGETLQLETKTFSNLPNFTNGNSKLFFRLGMCDYQNNNFVFILYTNDTNATRPDRASNGNMKVNDTWKQGYLWKKINGSWKRCIIWKKINGIWKKGV